MSDLKRARARGVPFREVLDERLQDPAFARAYEELEPEFQLICQIIELRNARKMTQTELARRTGTTQSSIARMESSGHIGTLHLLERVAEALDARVEISLIPNKATRGRNSKRARRMTDCAGSPTGA